MRGINGLSGVRPGLVVVGLIVCGSIAQASPIPANIVYSTSAMIGADRMTGSPVVGFQGVAGGSVVAPPSSFQAGEFVYPFPAGYASNVPLGEFTLAVPPAGTSTTYNDTPFNITFKVNSVNGGPAAADPQTFVLGGSLNGTVNGLGQSNLKATLISVSTDTHFTPEFGVGGFNAGGLGYDLSVPNAQVLVQSSDATASAVLVSVAPVPEPGMLGIFAVLTAGLVGYRRFRTASCDVG